MIKNTALPWHAVGNSTTVSAGTGSATMTLQADSAGNTTGVLRRFVFTMVSGGAHIKFLVGTTVGTATTNDYLIGSQHKFLYAPSGCTTLAYIAAAATTSSLNIASVET